MFEYAKIWESACLSALILLQTLTPTENKIEIVRVGYGKR